MNRSRSRILTLLDICRLTVDMLDLCTIMHTIILYIHSVLPVMLRLLLLVTAQNINFTRYVSKSTGGRRFPQFVYYTPIRFFPSFVQFLVYVYKYNIHQRTTTLAIRRKLYEWVSEYQAPSTVTLSSGTFTFYDTSPSGVTLYYIFFFAPRENMYREIRKFHYSLCVLYK